VEITDAQFEQWTREAMRLLPKKFADAIENIAIDVEAYPSMKVRKRLGLGRGQLLLGLYTGVPLTERTHQYGVFGTVPDKIVLYKRNIELVADTPQDVRVQVAETLLHEVGHYFGMTEEQLRVLELTDGDAAEDSQES